MGKLEKLYEGKAKKIYATENQEEVIIYYKDDTQEVFRGNDEGTFWEWNFQNITIEN